MRASIGSFQHTVIDLRGSSELSVGDRVLVGGCG